MQPSLDFPNQAFINFDHNLETGDYLEKQNIVKSVVLNPNTKANLAKNTFK